MILVPKHVQFRKEYVMLRKGRNAKHFAGVSIFLMIHASIQWNKRIPGSRPRHMYRWKFEFCTTGKSQEKLKVRAISEVFHNNLSLLRSQRGWEINLKLNDQITPLRWGF